MLTNRFTRITIFYPEHEFFLSQSRLLSNLDSLKLFISFFFFFLGGYTFLQRFALFHWKRQDPLMNRMDRLCDRVRRNKRHEEADFPPAKPIGRRYRLRYRNACPCTAIIISFHEKFFK